MIFKAKGIKALFFIILIFIVAIAVLVFIFQLFLFLLPIILLFLVLGYLFRKLNKVKKETNKDYIDVKFKVKK